MFIVDSVRALYEFVLNILYQFPAHSGDPITASVFIFLNGGWILVVVYSFVALEHLWVEWRAEKFEHAQTYILLAVEVPRLNEQSPKAIENIFSMAWGTGGRPEFIAKYIKGWTPNRFSFEIVSNEGHIRYYIRCRERMRDLIEAAIYSEYPLAEIQEVEDYVASYPKHWPNPEYDIANAEFLLSNPDNYPIKTWPFFEDKLVGEFKDPLAHVIEALNKLGPGEMLSYQICLTPTDSEWKKTSEALIAKVAGLPAKVEKYEPGFFMSIFKEIYEVLALVVKTISSDKVGEVRKEDAKAKMAFTPLEKEALEGLSMKASKVGFKTKIRAVYVSKKGVGKGSSRLGELSAALSGFASHNLNSFKRHWPSSIKSEYAWQKSMLTYWLSFGFYRPAPIRTLYAAANWRNRSILTAGTPYIMSTEELATIWHFPTMLIKSPLLRKIEAKRAEPPSNVPFREDMVFPFERKAAIAHGLPVAHEESGTHEKPQEVPENLPFV